MQEWFAGSHKTLELTLTDTEGNAIDSTGWEVRFALKRKDTDPTALVTKISTDPLQLAPKDGDDSLGIWRAFLLPADGEPLERGSMTFGFEVTTTDAIPLIVVVAKEPIELKQRVAA